MFEDTGTEKCRFFSIHSVKHAAFLQNKTKTMATYCYFDIRKVHDEAAMQEYRERVLTTVDQFNGRYVVIGGPFETKEGSIKPVFPVMIEFPTLEKAEGWYNSEVYQDLKLLRCNAVDCEAVFFQGI